MAMTINSTADPLVDELKPLEPGERSMRWSIPLVGAMLCIDCDRIYEAHGDGCPSCGARARMPVTRFIRPLAEDEQIREAVGKMNGWAVRQEER